MCFVGNVKLKRSLIQLVMSCQRTLSRSSVMTLSQLKVRLTSLFTCTFSSLRTTVSNCQQSQLHLCHLTTVGRRSFPVAASIIWNISPVHVQSSPSIFTFHLRLKTFLLSEFTSLRSCGLRNSFNTILAVL